MRRQVRTTTQFWAALDAAMPAGRESWRDFAAIDLPHVLERFATDWAHLPPLIPDLTTTGS